MKEKSTGCQLNRTSGSEPVDLSCNAVIMNEKKKILQTSCFLNYVYIFHSLFHFFKRKCLSTQVNKSKSCEVFFRPSKLFAYPEAKIADADADVLINPKT